jgi:hypothetical protein
MEDKTYDKSRVVNGILLYVFGVLIPTITQYASLIFGYIKTIEKQEACKNSDFDEILNADGTLKQKEIALNRSHTSQTLETDSCDDEDSKNLLRLEDPSLYFNPPFDILKKCYMSED